ncbi:hypothetical protein N431DRAFT_444347 [Stipitochalara longipes BDJ]|nr:hypothetical protein N431DRAFT_444347 [Stipitochalara longipes BDJ]
MKALLFICVAPLLFVAAHPTNADGTLKSSNSSATMRYEAGDVATVQHTINRAADGLGWVSLGLDGVFRSYAGDGSVIDWRQLDPDQIAADLATQARVPNALPAEAYGDGRLVTDINLLRQPWQETSNKDTTSEHANIPRSDSSEMKACAIVDGPEGIVARGPDWVRCGCIACRQDRFCYHSKLNEDCTWCRLGQTIYGDIFGFCE